MSDDVLFSALGDASLVRLGEIVMILELHRQGVSISAIARRVALDRKTVRRYIAQGLEPPTYGPRQPRISQLRAFEPYLGERLVAFPQLTGRRLHRELGDLGYSGGYSILTDLLREIRPVEVSSFEVPWRRQHWRTHRRGVGAHPEGSDDAWAADGGDGPDASDGAGSDGWREAAGGAEMMTGLDHDHAAYGVLRRFSMSSPPPSPT